MWDRIDLFENWNGKKAINVLLKGGNLMLLENKVAIVTGGSRGIGYATVEAFLQEGVQPGSFLSTGFAFSSLQLTGKSVVT